MKIGKYIKGYENYQITMDGFVYSIKTKKYLQNVDDGKGYYFVSLYKDGKRKNFRIHQLVAEYFIGNPYNLPQVNHIDGNKKNNHYVNLEYVSASENIQHAYNTGLKLPSEKQKSIARKMCIELKSKKVYDIKNGTIYKSAVEASKCLNININTLRGYLTNFRPNKTSLIYI